jgi:hypothetical protein
MKIKNKLFPVEFNRAVSTSGDINYFPSISLNVNRIVKCLK